MKIGCVILAGGKSSRMGEDKALLDFEGQNFIKKIADELSFFEEKIIARGNNSVLIDMDDVSWGIIPDVYPDHGPIGGLHAALKQCDSDMMFCVSCDVPLMSETLAKKICNAYQEEHNNGNMLDAVIAVGVDGKYHPLCGVYRKELYKLMEEHILQNNNRMMAVFKKCRVKYVQLDAEESKQLTNVNMRSEYEKITESRYLL